MHKILTAALLASSAMALGLATPAYADKKDRAQEAIAAAEAKLHTAEALGTGAEVPRETAEARAALAIARENLKSGHKSDAISAAIHAQALADTAIGEGQRRKDQAVADAQAAQAAQRDSQEAQRESVAAARDQAAIAQQQAADANSRADAAQQSAAASAAEAAAARNAAALAAQTPPTQVETTVTTQQPATRRSSTKTVVKKRTTAPTVAAPSSSVTTTTKVTQPPPN